MEGKLVQARLTASLWLHFLQSLRHLQVSDFKDPSLVGKTVELKENAGEEQLRHI